MNDLVQIFRELLEQYGSVDIANAEFKRLVAEDEGLRDVYRQWCHDTGITEKNGFLDFCDEYMNDQDSIWDYLGDLDE